MPQTHQEPAEGPDKTAKPTEKGQTKAAVPEQPSLLGPKGDPAEGKREVGPKPN